MFSFWPVFVNNSEKIPEKNYMDDVLLQDTKSLEEKLIDIIKIRDGMIPPHVTANYFEHLEMIHRWIREGKNPSEELTKIRFDKFVKELVNDEKK